MARGRKKAAPEISALEAYKIELDRLVVLEAEAAENLKTLQNRIAEIREAIKTEEMKELWEMMAEKGVSVEEMKSLLNNKDSVEEM